MADVETLRALLERVRTANGPNPQIDADLYAVQEGWDGAHLADNGEVHRLLLETVEGNRRTYGFTGETIDSHELPMFTDSLDYALDLVARMLPDARISLDINEAYEAHRVHTAFVRPQGEDESTAYACASPALAVCSGLLSASSPKPREPAMPNSHDTSTLAGALAYLCPVPSNNGTISLRAPEARKAVETIEAAIAALRSQDRGARDPSEFRVGRQVPRNVYRGDTPMFMAATEAEAGEMVALLNAGRLALAEQEASRG